MAESQLVYVILLTWNQREDTLECLRSVAQIAYPNFRVALVDNGSTDGTVEAVQAEFPQVEYIDNGANRGFSAAANRGMAHALERGAEYLFLLNNDTVVEPGLLAHLVAVAGAPSVGMVVPKIYYYHQPRAIWSVGAGLNRWTLEKKGDVRGALDDGQWETVVEREHVTACAVLLPRRVIEAIGFLDERFFYYYDDADLSLRVQAAGFRILLAPQARLWHKVAGASGGVDTPYERYWMARSSVLFFRKHVHGWRWLIVGPYRFASALKTTLRLLLKGRGEAALAYWRGLRDGLRGLPA